MGSLDIPLRGSGRGGGTLGESHDRGTPVCFRVGARRLGALCGPRLDRHCSVPACARAPLRLFSRPRGR